MSLSVELEEAGVLDHFSAKKAVWLFVRCFDELKEKEQEELLAMRQASAKTETIYQLVQEFFRLIRSLQGAQLDTWIAKVAASQIKELKQFANGLERDKAAVLAGLTLVHSNGQVEGQVTRIKRDFAHDVRSGRVCPAAPACLACSLRRLSASRRAMGNC